MGKALAIKGHSTRGKEVIELLEMLGGSNIHNLSGDKSYAYYINAHENIIRGIDYLFGYEDMKFFTLENFLEKYPYKVGDKVKYKVNVWVNYDYLGRHCTEIETAEITSMRWNSACSEIAYRLKDINEEFYIGDIKGKVDDDENLFNTTNEYEEIVDNSFQGGYEKCKLDIQLNGYELPDGYHFTDENGNVIDATKILIKKNTPTYPKTYEACWKVFGLKHNLSLWWNAYDAHSGIVSKLPKELLGIKESIESLSKLLVCRNVYWKLYGEEIGLDGSWEPDWNDNNQPKFGIHNVQNDIRTINLRVLKNLILVFPTEEMRDVFYGNFKDLIETCKELL
jgi:hypothetical protein